MGYGVKIKKLELEFVNRDYVGHLLSGLKDSRKNSEYATLDTFIDPIIKELEKDLNKKKEKITIRIIKEE